VIRCHEPGPVRSLSAPGPVLSAGEDRGLPVPPLPQVAGLPLAIRNVPGALPVSSKNFWMLCRSGPRHSDRDAQWVLCVGE
jgi:hypothetical protein